MLDIHDILEEKIYYEGENINKYKDVVTSSIYRIVEIASWDRNIFKKLYEVQLNGFIPIIKYPEKIKEIKNNPNIINHFIDSNCLFLLDVKSINGRLGATTKRIANGFLKHNLYNFISYEEDDSSYKNIFENYNNSKDIFKESFEKLLKNENIDFLGVKTSYKRLWRFL